jgi:hypothetical protein
MPILQNANMSESMDRDIESGFQEYFKKLKENKKKCVITHWK